MAERPQEPKAGEPSSAPKDMSKAAEEWVDQQGKRIDQAMKRMPVPVNALGDSLCLGVTLYVLAWLANLIGWLKAMPSWTTVGVGFAAVFVVCLACRLVVKSRRKAGSSG